MIFLPYKLRILLTIICVLLSFVGCESKLNRPRKYNKVRSWNSFPTLPELPPMDTERNTSNADADENDFKTLEEKRNITLTSKECKNNGCTGSWGAWQSWSECNIPLPNRSPMCHNTLRLRKRFCAHSEICHEMHWEYCVDVSSCIGQWTQWGNYNGNCDIPCTKEIHRNRTCLDPNGVEAPGLCLGSKTEQNQYDVIKCPDVACGFPFEVTLGLIIGGSALFLLLLVVIIAVLCVKRNSKRCRQQGSSLETSQSFLLSQWRVISQRFTRRARSEPGIQERQEVAIRNNYSAVHVYENPDDYSEVLDVRAESNIYENNSQAYEEPSCSSESADPKSRTSTVLSEERYEYIGVSGPYASMKSLESFSDLSRKDNFKRAHSVDDALMVQRNINRTQPLPGFGAGKIPLPRGVSQFDMHKNKRLTKKPSNAFKPIRNTGGVASKITKRKNSTRRHYVIRNPRQDIAMCSAMRSNAGIEEDQDGYLVPNISNRVWRRQKNQTFSGGITRSPPKFKKSVSLPVEVETYVTMNCVKANGHCRMDSEKL